MYVPATTRQGRCNCELRAHRAENSVYTANIPLAAVDNQASIQSTVLIQYRSGTEKFNVSLS